jgi:hypothetical protein
MSCLAVSHIPSPFSWNFSVRLNKNTREYVVFRYFKSRNLHISSPLPNVVLHSEIFCIRVWKQSTVHSIMENLLNAAKFKHTRINVGNYSVNSRRNWLRQLSEHCANVLCPKCMLGDLWGGGVHRFRGHVTVFFPQETVQRSFAQHVVITSP